MKNSKKCFCDSKIQPIRTPEQNSFSLVQKEFKRVMKMTLVLSNGEPLLAFLNQQFSELGFAMETMEVMMSRL